MERIVERHAAGELFAGQIELLREYYECDTIKVKVSAARFKALCRFDTTTP